MFTESGKPLLPYNNSCNKNMIAKSTHPSTVGPPLTDTSIQRTPPNNGQIFSSQNTLWQKVTPPYGGHLSTTDDKIGPIGVRYMEVPLYI